MQTVNPWCEQKEPLDRLVQHWVSHAHDAIKTLGIKDSISH